MVVVGLVGEQTQTRRDESLVRLAEKPRQDLTEARVKAELEILTGCFVMAAFPRVGDQVVPQNVDCVAWLLRRIREIVQEVRLCDCVVQQARPEDHPTEHVSARICDGLLAGTTVVTSVMLLRVLRIAGEQLETLRVDCQVTGRAEMGLAGRLGGLLARDHPSSE